MEKGMQKKLQVFYDGGCIVCNFEINHYIRRDKEGRIDWVDINQKGFNAENYGLHPMKVRERFHSITDSGEILDGVDSFLKIWKILGIFKLLIFLAEYKYTRNLLDLGYKIFTIIRPYLPRYKSLDCGDACAITYSTEELDRVSPKI